MDAACIGQSCRDDTGGTGRREKGAKGGRGEAQVTEAKTAKTGEAGEAAEGALGGASQDRPRQEQERQRQENDFTAWLPLSSLTAGLAAGLAAIGMASPFVGTPPVRRAGPAGLRCTDTAAEACCICCICSMLRC